MAACGSLRHVFDKPLPENPTLMECLSSWKHIKSTKPIEPSSLTEIFGELHFKESSDPSPSSSSSTSFLFPSSSSSSSYSSSSFNESNVDNNEINKNPLLGIEKNHLQLCTEGLGSESFDDVEDKKDDWESYEKEERSIMKNSDLDNLCWEIKKSKINGGRFPPPISCLGRSGKPWICFKSYRHDGRFVLKEIKIPTQEFLRAFREDGRLKLQFVQPDDEIPEDEYIEEEEEEEESKGEEEKEVGDV